MREWAWRCVSLNSSIHCSNHFCWVRFAGRRSSSDLCLHCSCHAQRRTCEWCSPWQLRVLSLAGISRKRTRSCRRCSGEISLCLIPESDLLPVPVIQQHFTSSRVKWKPTTHTTHAWIIGLFSSFYASIAIFSLFHPTLLKRQSQLNNASLPEKKLLSFVLLDCFVVGVVKSVLSNFNCVTDKFGWFLVFELSLTLPFSERTYLFCLLSILLSPSWCHHFLPG